MEENKNHLEETSKENNTKHKAGKGTVIALVIVIILAIAAVVGTWYYMNNKAKNDKKAQDAQIQQLQKQVDDLKKSQQQAETASKLYTTKYELLKFAYNNGWTISDTSVAKDSNSLITPGRDIIKLTSPNGFVITIDAGLYGIGGSCETCSVLYSEPITVLGKSLYLNYVQNTENGKGVSTIILSQKSDETFGGIYSKNIKGINGDQSIMMISAKYPNGNSVTVKDLNTIKADPNVQELKSLLKSLSY